MSFAVLKKWYNLGLAGVAGLQVRRPPESGHFYFEPRAHGKLGLPTADFAPWDLEVVLIGPKHDSASIGSLHADLPGTLRVILNRHVSLMNRSPGLYISCTYLRITFARS